MKRKTENGRFPRGAGILLPVGSLPSDCGIGTLGTAAFAFLDFLKAAGQKYWQVLPVGPTGFGDSPYQSFSVFAGNPYFIDLDLLAQEGLLGHGEIDARDWGEDPARVDYEKLWASRFKVLRAAFRNSRHFRTPEYRAFCEENAYWLEDYSLYMAVKTRFENGPWLSWPRDIRLREPEAVARYSALLREETDFWRFCQFLFFRQWGAVREYARKNGVSIIGDMPIYAALDSADVWAHPDLFQLDAQRRPLCVAGVPPDAFSRTGQLWGNPLYDWDAMERTDFLWWKKRMEFSAKLYDVIRIDHFIGIVRYFSIPAGAETAADGVWRKGPGERLLGVIRRAAGTSRVIAEDLGVAVPAVRRLLKKSGCPGMRVLEFAFDGNPENEHLPHMYQNNLAVYGGTHDNETLAGYFSAKRPEETRRTMEYLGVKRRRDIPWAAARALYASVADTVVLQAQDLLCLPNTARMNFPSTIGENWRWRLLPGQLTNELAQRLQTLVRIYGR